MLRKFDAPKNVCFENDQNVWRITLLKFISTLSYVEHDLSRRYCHTFMSALYKNRQHVSLMFGQPRTISTIYVDTIF